MCYQYSSTESCTCARTEDATSCVRETETETSGRAAKRTETGGSGAQGVCGVV